MKLPNRTGTVCRLSGSRHKPWMARIYTPTGYKVLGYYHLKSEAVTALLSATAKVPDRQTPVATLEDVYLSWSAIHFPRVSPAVSRQYEHLWGMIKELHHKPIAYLTVEELEKTITAVSTSRSMPFNIKILLGMIYKYGMRYDLVQRNIAEALDFHKKQTDIIRKSFSYPEVTELFESEDMTSWTALVGIYTGMRPGELMTLTADEVDLEAGFFYIHGSKTKSGHFRHIPIHPAILSTVEKMLKFARKNGLKTLAVSHRGKRLTGYSYAAFMDHLGHTPHDTRHTFVTYAHKSGMDALAIKRIVGHVINDITEAVYTHLDDDYLASQMRIYRVL